ncbi:MAG: RluA family pseudouridine synthase [Kiritimatiellae bacterium]|nr:RluA family pseudouridine synthase [Kiritimatiellia bacterium]
MRLTVESPDSGTRLDIWLARRRPEFSRARWQQLIRSGHVRVGGAARKPNHKLAGTETIEIEIPAPEPVGLAPEAIPLDVLFEDADLIVINKPPGLVVHPAAGHRSGTLVNALLHHCKDLPGIGGEIRPGIVHRLDKDTSGALVVAKTDAAMNSLVAQFKAHAVKKQYLALVWGRPQPPGGAIRTLVGRSVHNRKKMSARPARGREAVTHYRTIEAFKDVSLLSITIETGRTHQIRVHMAHLGHPVVGDRQYGRARQQVLPAPRQMLHAERLAFQHPRSGEQVELTAAVPEDMQTLLLALRGSQPA